MGRLDVDVSLRRAESFDVHDQTGTCALATSHVARRESGASACRARRMAPCAEEASWSRDALSMSAPSHVSTQLPDALAMNALDCPPPYSMVAQESTHFHTLTSREPLVRSSSEPEFSHIDTDAASVSSGDLLLSDEDEECLYHRRRRRTFSQQTLHQHDMNRMKYRNTKSQPSFVAAAASSSAHGARESLSRHYRGILSMVPSFLASDSPMSSVPRPTEQVEPLEPLPLGFELLLHSLRLFAVVPGLVGTVSLLQHSYQQALNYRWLRTNFMSLTPSAIEYFFCSLWSICTAFHALSLMTMLLRRWLIYYTLVPSLIRLITFQSICWSLVRWVLWCFGPSQPAAGWIVISTFTSFFEILARWITSNITDVDLPSSNDGANSDVNETGVSDAEGLHSDQEDLYHLLHSRPWRLSRSERFRLYREGGVRVIRALTGAPDDGVTSESDTELPGKPEANQGSSVPGAQASTSSPHTLLSQVDMERWHRRLDERRRQRKQRRRYRPRKQKTRMSAFFQNYRAARIHSRRVFHWNVAVWRNVVPIGILGYVTLWVFLIEFTITRFQSN